VHGREGRCLFSGGRGKLLREEAVVSSLHFGNRLPRRGVPLLVGRRAILHRKEGK